MSFTLAPLRRILVKHGAKRVSDEAAHAFAQILEQKTARLLQEADKIAQHSGRTTVLERDVKLARRVVEESG